MFIHIGGDKVVRTKDVIMILDKNALLSKDTSDFLQIAKEEGFVAEGEQSWQDITEDKKTTIILDKKILFSPISSTTLSKRSRFLKNLK